MSAALVKLLIQVAGAAVLIAFVFVLQTRRISRIWLRWIPQTLRETISPYFDPPPSIHPDVPDPNEIEPEEDAAPREKIAAGGLRILLRVQPMGSTTSSITYYGFSLRLSP
jgi:hypothetical protein